MRTLSLVLLLAACSTEDGKDGSPTNGGSALPAGTIQWAEDVTVDQDFLVAPDETLRIEAGVTITLAEGASIVVQGGLQVLGTDDQPVLFTGDPEARWNTVLFEDTSADAVYERLDDHVSGSIVQHAIFEYGSRAITTRAASPYIVSSLFRHNESPPNIENLIGGAALSIEEGSYPRVRDCTFEDNYANLFGQGGAISVFHADPVLQNNTFVRNSSSYGGALTTDLMAGPIVGNLFEDNDTMSEGGGLSLVSSIATVLNNHFEANRAVHDGGGLHVCVTCYPHAAPFVFDNNFLNNVSDGGPSHGAGGLGAAYLRAMADNNLEGNTSGGEPSDFGWFHPLEEDYPEWVSHPSIAGNYWGTTDAAALAATIFDGTDVEGEGLGAVTYDPALSARVEGPRVRATIASRKLRYVDAGDEMPVFVTLYNPGPETTLHVQIRHGSGETFTAFTEPLDHPEAVASGEGYDVVMPQDSVWFSQITTDTYDGTPSDDTSWWEIEATAADVEVGPAVRTHYARSTP